MPIGAPDSRVPRPVPELSARHPGIGATTASASASSVSRYDRHAAYADPTTPYPPSRASRATATGAATGKQSPPPGRSFIRILTEGSLSPPSPPLAEAAQSSFAASTGATGPTTARARSDQPALVSLGQLTEHALRTEKTIDAMIAAARGGKTFTATELIALQATVFRYSQMVEVVSRATDRLIGAIKQTIGAQI